MSEINSVNDYTSQYNAKLDYSGLLSSDTSSSSESAFSLNDYASIQDGSYKKLLKAYYAKQDAEKGAGVKDTPQKLILMKSSADALKQSADALKRDSLWEKKTIRKKDEVTGKETETEDYDREAIKKAVKSFAENYNSVVEEAGKSNVKEVLRNAAWMTDLTSKHKNLLSEVGIEIGKGNKLEIDEDKLKNADINSLKSLFLGRNSFANQISYKADRIGSAANKAGAGYTSKGTYDNQSTLSSVVPSKIDKEV